MKPRVFRFLILELAMAAFLAGAASAQDSSGIKNLQDADIDLMNNHDPASELENFELLSGYQVNLFASDPMLANPVHMHWDSKGRLWVACSWAYPQLKPGEVANDKIIILEDTNGDGAADKSTVFADGLYLPTGLEFANGGCYVAQSPDVFFLKDTDGDDVADVKELALTGFGIEDSHHSISAWRRGPGGWLYFQEGIFLHAQVETQHGVVRNFNGGVFQFNPRSQELRMFCRGTGGNPWGHVFDRWGQSFMVNNPRIMYLSPATGNSGESVRIQPLISTEKQCGGDLATGTHVGDDIRGQLLTCRFKSRTVVRYEFVEDGAGFNASVLPPLISSVHPNFRPVDVKIGPDGAVYVADWYNSIINHAQHDFRDPRRDHDHGRIWRITHKERPLVQKPQLDGASIQSLVNELSSPQDWNRHQARKELSERDPAQVLRTLEAWVETLSDDDPDHDHHLVEAMWACQNAGRVSEKILNRVMAAEDGHARSAGARLIRYWHEELTEPIQWIAKASADSFPRTRMEAVLSAGFIPRAEAFVAALNALDSPADPMVDQALTQTTKALKPYWQPAMESGALQFAKQSHREFAQRGMGIGLEDRLANFLQQTSPVSKEIAELQSLLLKSGTAPEVTMVLRAFARERGVKSSEAKIALLETLERMAASRWPGSIKRSARGLRRLLSNEDDTIAVLAANNLGAWGVAGDEELAAMRSGNHSAAVSAALAIALSQTNGKRYASQLKDLATSGDLTTRYAAVIGLVHADLEAGAELAARILAEDPSESDPITLVRSFLNQKDGAQHLSDALQNNKVHPAVVASVSQFHRHTGLLPDSLAKRFRSNASSALSAELLAENIDALTADVERLGDPARGEMIYRRWDVACTRCHAVGSAGPEIGPNLVAVGGAATTKYMVQSILKPNAAIAEHYETKTFLLESSTVQTGIVVFRNETEVVVRDSANPEKEVRLAVAEIEAEVPAKSLMPAGLADQLQSRGEFLDLAKFVSLLGKPGPYANDETPVVRKWRVVEAPAIGALPAEHSSWQPAYSKVNGELPIEDLPLADRVFARGFVNILVPGMMKLEINQLNALDLWIDAVPVTDLGAAIKLERGRHTLKFAIHRSKRDTGLRVELKPADDVVRFKLEGGP
ncbi:PVC-type heme-binding CxxCH protein [Aureliella helgolandensis]|uniref:Cytochrome c domain-containing protein n=1 Tax=Aureliella helgolandensis TaxID=2527968 RepID=A0A518GB83_9BACT|nr:PVC-type heme-binding CxxCH protein [Aureliella helgolandensis]QDV25807.1 hypothetical protein Q31a_41350 [Aureliella helgolandensis]